jgi:hypothetical protein
LVHVDVSLKRYGLKYVGLFLFKLKDQPLYLVMRFCLNDKPNKLNFTPSYKKIELKRLYYLFHVKYKPHKTVKIYRALIFKFYGICTNNE